MHTQVRPRLSFWQIWNMSFGFLGIQFGFALQGGNVTRIFQSLGAEKDDLPLLWIAAPLTGLIVQPVIGYLSDRTWSPRWGRRRPYFLLGAVLSTLALLLMPHSPALWVAVGALWVLDASINISMEPFRALVADKLPEDQRSFGFVVQTLIIGIGTWVASQLPWLVHQLGVPNEAGPGEIPPSLEVSFAIGALVFLTSILFTVFTTDEAPPADMQEFLEERRKKSGLLAGVSEVISLLAAMPTVMFRLGIVQFFSWFAFFTMWTYATPALTEHVFHAPMPAEGAVDFDTAQAAYSDAADRVSSAMGVYGLTSMAFALLLAFVTARHEINRRVIHLVSLLLGGLGFTGMAFLSPETSWALWICFAFIGFAWGSMLSMPYAMLSGAIPESKMGVYMGLFNMFIVLPQIVAALGAVNWLYQNLLGEATIGAMSLAGIFLVIAAFSNLLIPQSQRVA
jgi:maltose/moltooligosaccharide transporter